MKITKDQIGKIIREAIAEEKPMTYRDKITSFNPVDVNSAVDSLRNISDEDKEGMAGIMAKHNPEGLDSSKILELISDPDKLLGAYNSIVQENE
jgi:hypothetical protein|tara:strand:+ start:1713 stop:1994 length:282 start_codon:yes stop_codon:yes gene_type:complete